MSRLLSLCFVLLAGIGSFSFSPKTQAAESYDNCTGFITVLPAVIDTQGTWCLNANLVTQITTGNAIEIQTHNVTIDCNDFKLGNGSANPATFANGIYSYGHLNAVVRNCNIRNFYIGINFAGPSSGGHIVEDNRLDGITNHAILVLGDGSVIRRNRVLDTGGTPGNASTFGISAYHSVDVIDNTVTNVFATIGGNGSSYGIYTHLNSNGQIANNRVRGVLKDGMGIAFGIHNTSNGRITLRSNDVTGNGEAGSYGIRCAGSTGSAGRAIDNVVNGFANGLTTCANDGNVLAP